MKRPQVELLAPASGLEAIRAAVCAGADAIYTGGTRFGARAYADNLAEEELLQAIDYVHLHGKHLYLTVNTLLKEQELENELVAYLTPYYRRGLDAVIVQDIGVFQVIKEHFPDMPIHISTQAVVTGANSAAYWEKLGADRIVTARELSLEEIRAIRENISIEIESFVHGALCYCYSGQCLFSSFLGGRSGNRGRCAQPCRLPYELQDEMGNVFTGHKSGKEQYLLSPKDMCTLDILPDIIEAGVFSLKIEGRMKRPEYTAGVVEIYRKYIDLYLKCKSELVEKGDEKPSLDKIKEKYHVSREDKERLMDLYNRGNFHSGYYTMHNGKSMMSMERPNHNGVFVGTMTKGKKGYVMKSQTDLHRQDVLEFRGVLDKQKNRENLELTIERDVNCGENYILPDKYSFLLGKRQSVEVYRTKNEQLLMEIRQKYMEKTKQRFITGRIVIREGEALSLMVSSKTYNEMSLGNENWQVIVPGDVVQSAQNQPVQEDYIRKQLLKTGNTPFVFEDLQIEIQGNCFVPVKALNELRRTALELLEKAIVEPYHRNYNSPVDNVVKENNKDCRKVVNAENKVILSNGTKQPQCHVSIEDLRQLKVLLSYEQIRKIYISIHCFSFLRQENGVDALEQLGQVRKQCHDAGKKLYLVFPYTWRKSVEDKLKPFMTEILNVIDGIVAKNMEVLTFVNNYNYNEHKVDVVADYTAYTMNGKGAAMLKQAGATMLTLPVELNKKELTALLEGTGSEDKVQLKEQESLPWEMVIYGHLPMMVSAQCPVKNTIGCQKKTMITRLKDRKGSRHYVKNYCDTCYSVIYNSEPMVLMDRKEELESLQLQAVRLQFTIETEDEIQSVLDIYMGKKQGLPKCYTRGHWKRGVE